jgi:hypothetical protein
MDPDDPSPRMPPSYRDDDRPSAPSRTPSARWRAERPRLVVVDGQEFFVQPRPIEPGTYDFTWTSGPNDGYGFSTSGGRREPLLPTEIEDNIRSFLSGINPDTGYLG